MRTHICLILLVRLLLSLTPARAQATIQGNDSPVAVIQRIGDKLIRDTPFKYRLVPVQPDSVFTGLHFVDFGRTFGLGKPAVAYAYTRLTASKAGPFTVQLEHNDGCKIWLNGAVIYEKKGNHVIRLLHDERSIELPNTLTVSLRQGPNELLIKSETSGQQWRVYMQPPSLKGAIVTSQKDYPTIGLRNHDGIDEQVCGLTNWLVVGPFANRTSQGQRTGLERYHLPESEIRFGTMYAGLTEPVTWTIPKIDLLGDVYNPLPWGTNYNWNYHNGGVVWAMQQLAERSGEARYADYASRFCDFQLASIPFVQYQINTLNAVNSANHHLVDTPLLDFTLAPSLPFIYRLRTAKSFTNRVAYESFINRMIAYARHGQLRLPGVGIYTRTTPELYTTWADDMFMGIPFLVQAALYTTDPALKKALLDDAARQIIGFAGQVWDPDANLYMHARFSTKSTKLPHWSRANGWAIWAMSDVLMHLPTTHPLYQPILTLYQKHAQSLLSCQRADGFWLNVLDRSDSKPEVSGTAIFTMALARGIRYGWLAADSYQPAVMNGWKSLTSQIDADGTVHAICMGTMCSDDVNYYLNRPFYDNDTHGLFAVLFAGLEVDKLLSKGTTIKEK